MSGKLLQTKLYVPRVRSSLVPRPRLIKRLNQGWQAGHKLTLISAPAGFGKTTLVVDWGMQMAQSVRVHAQNHNELANSAPVPHMCWLSLDEEDAELLRFLTYFIAALQTALPTIGEDVMAALQSPQPPSAELCLTALINEIASLRNNFILVLDDYHLIDALPADNALAFFIDHLPPQMHLVITTREDPQLPLSRLRARNQLTDLRAADLRFTTDEAATFLNQVMGLNLTTDDVTSLETRTEGWIAGLQLAAISLQDREDVSDFISAFAGDNRYIVDYLAEEVLQRQPEHVRSFLLQTSILNRLSGPLCNAVTGQTKCSMLLETLERNNLFVISLDDKRHWYRYHHLFADVLHAHMMREQPDIAPALHQRASQWYAQNNFPADAIRHALIAQDFERAAALIEMVWPALLNGFRPATWRGWVKALPDELVSVRPVLNVGCAWTLLDDGELEEADAYLAIAERLLTGAAAHPDAQMVVVNEAAFRTLPASIASARAYLAQAQGDVLAAIKNARRALDLFPEEEHYHRGIAAMFLGLAYWTDGDLAAAHHAISDSVAYMQKANNSYFQVIGTAMLADIKAAQGHLREAARVYEQSLQFTMGEGGFVLRETAVQHIGLSALYREWDDLEAAVEQLQKGQKGLAEQAVLPGSESRWCAAMARIKAAAGDLAGTLDLLHEAARLYKRDPIPDVQPVAALQARIWVMQGRLDAAQDWAQKRGLSADDALCYLQEFEYITLARIRIAQYRRDREDGAIHEALSLLARLLQAAGARGRMRSVIEILVLQALAYQEQGDMSKALAAIFRALALAEPEGYIRLFADEGLPMRALLAAALAQGTDPVYVTLLMHAIDPQTDEASPAPDPNQLLIEPLSNREIEVLGLLANGLSNQAIADELVIALSTVKKHVNNIFGKLNVASRTQAVNRARDLNIL